MEVPLEAPALLIGGVEDAGAGRAQLAIGRVPLGLVAHDREDLVRP